MAKKNGRKVYWLKENIGLHKEVISQCLEEKSYYPMTYGENLCSTEILFDLILLIINCHILLEINNVLK